MTTSIAKPHPVCFFYVITDSGETVEWRGLTEKQARDMYAYTSRRAPMNVQQYGWEKVKPQETVK